jgi:nucleotide-binding universal stress UspA family protein
MPRFKSILCPIDFSDCSAKAYDYAQSLAWHYKAELLVQHVRYSFPAFYIDASYKEIRRKLRTDALQKLRGFVKRLTRTKVQPQCVVHEGCRLSESSLYSDRILSFAEAQAVNLIVMGTHGLGGVDRLMLGSVTEKVLRKARCPVLVVRKPAHDFVSPGGKADPINIKKIVLCMDFSKHAQRAMNHAFSIAKQYNAELTLLHVLEHPPGSSHLQSATAKATEQLRESVPPRAIEPSRVKFLVRIGKPYQQIIDVAMEAHTDLVIMGVRGRSSLNSALFGSTTYRVIQLGPCPVLVIHA